MASEAETAEVLIAEIQARPALWNLKLAEYKNKNIKDRLYAEIGGILGISKETVAARWKNKKDKYRRELKKVPVGHSGDAAENYKSSWPYFEMMSFMKDLLIPAVKSGNLPALNELSQDDDIEDVNEENTDTRSIIDPTDSGPSAQPASASNTPSREERPSSSASTSTSISQQGRGNRKRLCDIRDEKFLALENKKLQLFAQHLSNNTDEPESEELNFFKSLIPYMTKFNPIQKLNVRNKIQQVILDELLSAENRDANRGQTPAPEKNVHLLSSQNPNYPQTNVPPNYLPTFSQYSY